MAPSEPELTPQQAERVRRLLAEARHDEPIPADVADRLDRVIAGLAEEDGARPAPVVRLAERRRRAGRLLLAAAVVVVGGVTVGQLVNGGVGQNESAGTDASEPAAESQAEGMPAPDREDEGSSGDSNLTDGGAQAPGAVSANRQSISKLRPQRLRSGRFSADALALRDAALDRRDGVAELRSAYQKDAAADVASCSPGTWGGGRYLRVSVDRDPGWLVYRPPRGDTQVVDLFLCGEDAPERSATLPFD